MSKPTSLREEFRQILREQDLFFDRQLLEEWNALVQAWKDQQEEFSRYEYSATKHPGISKMSDDWRLNTGLEGPTMVALGK